MNQLSKPYLDAAREEFDDLTKGHMNNVIHYAKEFEMHHRKVGEALIERNPPADMIDAVRNQLVELAAPMDCDNNTQIQGALSGGLMASGCLKRAHEAMEEAAEAIRLEGIIDHDKHERKVTNGS